MFLCLASMLSADSCYLIISKLFSSILLTTWDIGFILPLRTHYYCQPLLKAFHDNVLLSNYSAAASLFYPAISHYQVICIFLPEIFYATCFLLVNCCSFCILRCQRFYASIYSCAFRISRWFHTSFPWWQLLAKALFCLSSGSFIIWRRNPSNCNF